MQPGAETRRLGAQTAGRPDLVFVKVLNPGASGSSGYSAERELQSARARLALALALA